MPNSERPTKKLDLGGGYSITLKTFINQREFLKLVAQNKDEAAQETAALVATEMYVPGKDIITDPAVIKDAILDLPRAQYVILDRAFVNLIQGNEIDHVPSKTDKGGNFT